MKLFVKILMRPSSGLGLPLSLFPDLILVLDVSLGIHLQNSRIVDCTGFSSQAGKLKIFLSLIIYLTLYIFLYASSSEFNSCPRSSSYALIIIFFLCITFIANSFPFYLFLTRITFANAPWTRHFRRLKSLIPILLYILKFSQLYWLFF